MLPSSSRIAPIKGRGRRKRARLAWLARTMGEGRQRASAKLVSSQDPRLANGLLSVQSPADPVRCRCLAGSAALNGVGLARSISLPRADRARSARRCAIGTGSCLQPRTRRRCCRNGRDERCAVHARVAALADCGDPPPSSRSNGKCADPRHRRHVLALGPSPLSSR